MNLGFTVRFVLAVLATWRVSHLLAAEDGPGDIIVRLRARLGQSFLGSLMDCFYCLSVWIAVPAALFVTREPLDLLMTWLAVSGAACLLERAGQKSVPVQPVYEIPPGGNEYVLRPETRPIEGQFVQLESPDGAHAGAAASDPHPEPGPEPRPQPGPEPDADSAHLVSAIDWDRAPARDGSAASAVSTDNYPDGYR